MMSLIEWLNSIGHQWLFLIRHAVWQAALVGLAVLLLVSLFSRLPSQLRYCLLVVALAKFVMPPMMVLPTGMFGLVSVTEQDMTEGSYSDASLSDSLDAVKNNSALNADDLARDGLTHNASLQGSRTLSDVQRELGECTRCRLCEGRNQIVFGDGDPNASLMFIGEGPGQEEDRRGLPFVGRAGELLTKMIEAGLQIPREDVYICNIVKCRPPKNRTPQPDEVATCKPFLDSQIDAIRPKTIVTLGRPATSLLLGRDVSITRVRGTWQSYRGIPVMPTFHPAFVLRRYTTENRRWVWEDLKKALERSKA